MKYVDYLVETDRQKEAIMGLAAAIKRLPGEGRYVPIMLDRLEKLCGDIDGTEELLVRFYSEFLPMVPPMRGKRPSKYCISVYSRGIELFRKNGNEQLVQMFEMRLTRIKAGKATDKRTRY